jgi:tyrosine-protein phosphatase YwqE
LQINLGSLAGMYGRKVRKAAEWMLKHDLVDFVGSDAHTPQQATEAFGEGLAVLLELVDEARQRRMLVDNPRQALTGETP